MHACADDHTRRVPGLNAAAIYAVTSTLKRVVRSDRHPDPFSHDGMSLHADRGGLDCSAQLLVEHQKNMLLERSASGAL